LVTEKTCLKRKDVEGLFRRREPKTKGLTEAEFKSLVFRNRGVLSIVYKQTRDSTFQSTKAHEDIYKSSLRQMYFTPKEECKGSFEDSFQKQFYDVSALTHQFHPQALANSNECAKESKD